MSQPLLKFILLFAVLGLFAGCSVDRAQIISHPSSAKPGDTISVLFSDIYIIITTTQTTKQPYSRDSLHIGYGLPSGWSLLSSDYYIATGIQMGQMSSLINDPSLIMALMQDSLALYMSRKLPMVKDNGWSGYFTGKTFSAHNIANTDSLKVNANTIDQWTAYSSRINLSVATGAKMDTGVALTSLPIDSSTRATIKSLYRTDSIWVKAIPIVCFARIIAGQAEVTDTLFYFTKTGTKPGPSSPFNYDKGDMTYAAITISNVFVQQMPLQRQTKSMLHIWPGTSMAGSRVNIDINTQSGWTLSISDIAGKMLWQADAPPAQGARTVVWDKTASNGSPVKPGMYLVRLQSGEQSASEVVRIIR
jgi:hypothetical protein